jgi:predicted nuclease of predicted toxin-antitoxin system
VKLLLDSCISRTAKEYLALLGHDVRWIPEDGRDPGDEEILRMSVDESRVIVTLDKDFGELAVVRRLPHCGILRLVGVRPNRQGAAIAVVLERYGTEPERGAIATFQKDRIRMRYSA